MAWGKRRESGPANYDPSVDDPIEEDLVEEELVEEDLVEPEPAPAAGLGESLRLRGELTGKQDVRIDGHFEGSITLQGQTLTVGATGFVQAEVSAHTVVVEGQLVGDITADDKVEIAATGSVQGNIRAARVVLKENSRFKGSVDTEWRLAQKAGAEPARVTGAVPAAVPAEAIADVTAEVIGEASNDAPTGNKRAPVTLADRLANWGDDQA